MSINDIAKALISNVVFNKIYDVTDSKELAGRTSLFVENSFSNNRSKNRKINKGGINRRINR